jgi:hypothetical protein
MSRKRLPRVDECAAAAFCIRILASSEMILSFDLLCVARKKNVCVSIKPLRFSAFTEPWMF